VNRQIARLALVGVGLVTALIVATTYWQTWATGSLAGTKPLAEVDPRRVDVALQLIPFAGIAFLWFIGVLRDRIGEHEDRFFATVFLGSGLLFLAMLFASAAIAGGLLVSYGAYFVWWFVNGR